MKELGKEHVSPSLNNDSQNAIDLVNNAVYHDRIKHIDVWYHIIHILLKDNVSSVKKIHASHNSADMLTKVVTVEKLKTCSVFVGLQG